MNCKRCIFLVDDGLYAHVWDSKDIAVQAYVRAGGVLLFGKMVMVCPKQSAQIFLRRGILALVIMVFWPAGVNVVLWKGSW